MTTTSATITAVAAPRPARESAPRAVLAWTATILALVLGAAMFVPTLLGMERYVITSGSMSGTYDRGSIVFAEVVPVSQLRVGDVITYQPPRGQGPKGLVTHRIAEIKTKDGTRVFRTKGDANAVADPWEFRLDNARQARVTFGVPLLGHAVALLSERAVRMLVIGLPALLIALVVLAGLWREAGAQTGPKRTQGKVLA